MAEPLLRVEGLTKRFGGVVASDGVVLDVRPGELHAIIGPNGAGKTTLIGQLTGELRSDAGKIHFDGMDITDLPVHARSAMGLARSFQITSLFRDFTVLDNVALAIQPHAGHSFRFWRNAREEEALREPAMATLKRVGLAHRANDRLANTSHGEHRQVELAMALASRPRLMLLDEPSFGLAPLIVLEIFRILRRINEEEKVSILLVEQNAALALDLADYAYVLETGRVVMADKSNVVKNDEGIRKSYLGY